MEYSVHTLSNGIRLIHKHTESQVAHCGVIINTGTRDENENEHGIAHFIEHVIFKGTTKRKTYHILSRMEDVGGEIDAFTTKENTCISASFMNNYYERAIELLSDILFNSTFPEKELIREKEVIYDEINSYKDSPAELIFDDFEEQLFKDHPIGRNILGIKRTLKKFTRKDILKFMANNYHTDQMVFCSVGNIKFDKLVKLFSKHFGYIPENKRQNKRIAFKNYKPEIKTIKKRTYQSHCIIGNIAYDMSHKDRLGLFLLNNILAGTGMNSRLNMVLREKHGLVYNVESTYSAYVDSGIISIYFGTEKENLEKSLALVQKELQKIRSNKMGQLQLHKAKRQIIGHIAISADSNSNLLYTIGKSYLVFNKVDSLEEMAKKIEAITAEKIIEIANDVLNPDKLSMLVFR